MNRHAVAGHRRRLLKRTNTLELYYLLTLEQRHKKHTHRQSNAHHVSQGSALIAPLGYVTFRYKQEHWLFSTHTLPSNHLPSGQWHPSVHGELHFALSLLIFRHVRGQDDPHSLYSNPTGHCKALRQTGLIRNVL